MVAQLSTTDMITTIHQETGWRVQKLTGVDLEKHLGQQDHVRLLSCRNYGFNTHSYCKKFYFIWLRIFIVHLNETPTNSTKYSSRLTAGIWAQTVRQVGCVRRNCVHVSFYFQCFRIPSSIYYLGNILSSSSRCGMCGTGGRSKCKRVRNTDPAWARNLSIFSADCWASQHIICLQLQRRKQLIA